MDVFASDARLLDNGEFDKDDHYIGHASFCHSLSFRVGVDCHEVYMIILRFKD